MAVQSRRDLLDFLFITKMCVVSSRYYIIPILTDVSRSFSFPTDEAEVLLKKIV